MKGGLDFRLSCGLGRARSDKCFAFWRLKNISINESFAVYPQKRSRRISTRANCGQALPHLTPCLEGVCSRSDQPKREIRRAATIGN